MHGVEDYQKVCVAMMFIEGYGHWEAATTGHEVRMKQAIDKLNIT